MIISVLLLILLLVVVPLFVGLIPGYFIRSPRRSLPMIYICGFLSCMALFQIVCVPVVLTKPHEFSLVVVIYSCVLAALSIVGITLAVVERKLNGNRYAEVYKLDRVVSKDEIVMWILAILVILIQMVMALITQCFDGDDAYYVVQSLLTVETDTMYSIKPYTGLSTSLDLRHALATMPMWVAYLSRISGMHPTIISHSCLGVVLIPLLYMIYYQCGRLLFRKDIRRLPIFLIFVSILYVFGNVSIYTNETFMMTRTWQGKAILANICILAVTWLVLEIYDSENEGKEMRIGYWVTLTVTNVVAAMCSTSSIFLIGLLIGIVGAVMTVHKKDVQVALRLLVTCVPLLIYAGIFLMV